MAIEDYIPNVFGQGMPSYIPGLLGQEEAAALQKRANVQGLLGAALSLAQGMSSQGPRRSAAQNILGAIAGGLQAGQGAYQGAVQNYQTQQQLLNAQLQQRKSMIDLQNQARKMEAVEEVIQLPEVANNPAMVAYFRAFPDRALERKINMDMVAQARREAQGVAPQAMPQSDFIGQVATQAAQEQGLIPRELPAVEVVANVSPYQTKIRESEILATMYDNFGTKEGADLAAQARERANYFRGLQRQEELVNGVAQSLSNVDPTLRRRADSLIANAPSLTQEQLQSKMDSILSEDAKLKEQLDPRFAQQRIAERKAGAPSTTINMPTESERTAGFLTNRVINSVQQLQAAVGASPTAASPNFAAEAIKFFTGSDYLKNLANPEKRQQVEAAQLEILDAALTLGTGAAYTKEQLENYQKSYFPQLNDKPATIKDKQQRLKSLIDSAMIKSGRAAPAAPSGVAPMFDMNAIDAELNRRKGK